MTNILGQNGLFNLKKLREGTKCTSNWDNQKITLNMPILDNGTFITSSLEEKIILLQKLHFHQITYLTPISNI